MRCLLGWGYWVRAGASLVARSPANRYSAGAACSAHPYVHLNPPLQITSACPSTCHPSVAGAAAGRTRLLVTNQLQYTPYADRVVVIDDGHIVAQVGPVGAGGAAWEVPAAFAGTSQLCCILQAHAVLKNTYLPDSRCAPSAHVPSRQLSKTITVAILPQGTYDECCSNEVFARLLREHNADHGAEGEAAPIAELPPGEPLGPAPNAPALMRADTTAIAQRAAAEALTATGRTGGDSGVQQARLAAAPTFAQRDTSGTADAAAQRGSKAEEEDASPEGGAKPAQGGKYGRQLARFETMIQQNRGDGKRPSRSASKVGC